MAMLLDEPRYPERLILIGVSKRRREIFTVFAERGLATIRIISARRATGNEGMKKATTKERPSSLSLKEMPEIDFSCYRISQNPYAVRIEREGVQLSHQGPSAASLKDMPKRISVAFASALISTQQAPQRKRRKSSTVKGVLGKALRVVQRRRAHSDFPQPYGRLLSRKRANGRPRCTPYSASLSRLT